MSSSVAPLFPQAPIPMPYDFSCGSDQLSLPDFGSEYDFLLQQPELMAGSSSAMTDLSIFECVPPALTNTLDAPCGGSSHMAPPQYIDAFLGMENCDAGLFPSFEYDSEAWMAAFNASLSCGTGGQAGQQFRQSAPFPLNYPTIG